MWVGRWEFIWFIISFFSGIKKGKMNYLFCKFYKNIFNIASHYWLIKIMNWIDFFFFLKVIKFYENFININLLKKANDQRNTYSNIGQRYLIFRYLVPLFSKLKSAFRELFVNYKFFEISDCQFLLNLIFLNSLNELIAVLLSNQSFKNNYKHWNLLKNQKLINFRIFEHRKKFTNTFKKNSEKFKIQKK